MSEFLLSSTGFYILFALFGAGAIGSLLLTRYNTLSNWVGNGFAALGSLWAFLFALQVLASGSTPTYAFVSTFPGLSLAFHVDALSAFFMLVISLISFLCSLYGLGYVRHLFGHYPLGTLGFFYNLFIAGMLAVVTAHTIPLFLIVWEVMSLASYFLVSFEHKDRENVRAGFLYLIMTHIGTAFILLAFILLFKATGALNFSLIQMGSAAVSPVLASIIFFSALIGFGIKAGIMPLHIWLPSAHPAAPSHVSALMSGVMIKTGIYMLIRMYFDLLPQGPVWWGAVLFTLGALSAVLGVLYALTEHDLKRLLAYHSIENIGIILLGVGCALIFTALDMPAVAMLGLIAALFHTLNHAVFKALLFLAAGSVVAQMHTRNIEKYGGLIRYMPATALCFLVGSMAISGLPPFNGFFSEWMTFQAMFAGISLSSPMKFLFVLGVAALALTSGLAAACFVKAFGAVFLARPRSDAVAHAQEATSLMKISMATLAGLTLVIGLLAGNISHTLRTITSSIHRFSAASTDAVFSVSAVSVRDGSATLSMPTVFFLLVLSITAAAVLTAIAARKQKSVIDLTWDCGTALTRRMEITATGFSHSIITVMRGVLRPTRQTEVEYHDAALRYFPKTSSVHFGVPDIYTNAYLRLTAAFEYASRIVRSIQNGNINAYILYILITFLGLLVYLAW